MKKVLTLCVIVGLSILVGCSRQKDADSNTNEAVLQKEIIKVGVIAPLSGPASTYGEDTVNALKIALEQINAKATDSQIELIVEDGKCSGADATAAAQKLITVDGVQVMLGGVCSSEALAASKIAQSYGVVNIVPASQAPSISEVGDYVFRYANGTNAAKFIGEQANELYSSVLIVSEKTEFAQSMAKEIKKVLGEKTKNDIQYDSSEKDFSLIAKQVRQKMDGTNAIIILPQTEGTATNLIKGFVNEGIIRDYDGTILGFPFFSSPSFLSNVGPIEKPIYNITLGPSLAEGTKAKEYYDKLQSKHGIKSVLYGRSMPIEALHAIHLAAEKGAKTSADFKSYFTGFTKENPHPGYLVSSYYFEGSDGIGIPYYIEKVENGGIVEVKGF